MNVSSITLYCTYYRLQHATHSYHKAISSITSLHVLQTAARYT